MKPCFTVPASKRRRIRNQTIGGIAIILCSPGALAATILIQAHTLGAF